MVWQSSYTAEAGLALLRALRLEDMAEPERQEFRKAWKDYKPTNGESLVLTVLELYVGRYLETELHGFGMKRYDEFAHRLDQTSILGGLLSGRLLEEVLNEERYLVLGFEVREA